MKPYADSPHRMAWQIFADLAALVAIVFSVRAGIWVYHRVNSVGQIGVEVEGVGTGLSGSLAEIGHTLGEIPLVGDLIADPFRNASNAAHGITDLGVAIQDQVRAIALVAGISVAVGPLILLTFVWLLPRLRFAVRAAKVHKIAQTAAGRDLLALRALATAPLEQLQLLSADVAADWRHGNTAIIEALALMEMDRAGVARAIEAPKTHAPKQIPPHLG